MKSTSKIVFGLLLITILVVGGLFIYVLGSLDTLVAGAIEKYGSEATQTAVRVKDVRIELREGKGAIHGLSIANPPGFSTPHAFVLGEISTRINLEALAEQNIVIDEINIREPAVYYEINAQRKGNLNVLSDNLGKDAPAAKPAPSTKPATGEQAGQGEAITLTIKRLVMQNAKLQASIVPLNNKQYSLTLPPFKLSNLHGTPEQITRQILDKLIVHARKAAEKAGLDRELDKVKAQARQRLEAEKAKQKKAVDERIEQEKKKAEDKLRDLLGR